MEAKFLECDGCGLKLPLKQYYFCPECDNILEVKYDYNIEEIQDIKKIIFKNPITMWDYIKLLPSISKIITLKEGSTPLHKLLNIEDKYNLKELYVKDETRNPTASFKDRPTSVGISKAISLKFDKVITASTGNGAASVAAYAAKAGIECLVFIPESTPINKVTQAISYGAGVVKVRGDYSNSFNLAYELGKKYSWANMTSTYLNPYTLEGDKTIAYELYYQLNQEVPEYIIVPIGAGPLLFGILKGYKELKTYGFINKLPKMIGVQAQKCSPIIKAYNQKKHKVSQAKETKTIASAISDPLIGYERDGNKTLKAIYESNGIGVSVNEEQIITAIKEISNTEGLFAEAAAAASWAGYKKLINAKKISNKEKAVLILTGHGLKQPNPEIYEDIEIPTVAPNVEDFDMKFN